MPERPIYLCTIKESFPFSVVMRVSLVLLFILLSGFVSEARAQPSPPTSDIYYVVEHKATLFREPTDASPYLELGFREPVFLQEYREGWLKVRTQDGAMGFVEEGAVSNVWIRVSKRTKMVYLYRGTDLIKKYPADFGYNAFADKEQRGSESNPDDWRTPEGVFFVVRKNPHSQFYKAFVLNYPNGEDATRGIEQGLISQREYDSIMYAERTFSMPPMNTALGGWIELHGDGTGVSSNWTHGCVAVHNTHMDELWEIVKVGTPVLVEQ